MKKTVIEHVLSRLHDLGIEDIFGVAGDYAFPIEDAVCAHPTLRWIGNCNELNAAYAADGYARINGFAALSTTFGVGELSAINGIAGSFAENLPVFHLVGMPASGVQTSGRLVHHTLADGKFDTFYRMAQPVVCAQAIMTPDNCVAETERLIACALRERRPVYIGLPSDYAQMPVHNDPEIAPLAAPQSDNNALADAVAAISAMLGASSSACILPGILAARLGLAAELRALVDRTMLPFATMFMDKSVLDEAHPQYIGMYNGRLTNQQVRAFVEECDCVLAIGTVMTDFNSGCFTARLEQGKSIAVMADSVRVGSAIYQQVYMKDLLRALAKELQPMQVTAPAITAPAEIATVPDGSISADYLYPRLEKMFKPNDIVIAETGTVSMGLGFARLPQGATFHNQTLWGAIGWATPAAFGAALAAPQRRTLLITGEGAHQLTAQEVSQFSRFGLKPIIFIVNNGGYLIERLLCQYPDAVYNDVAQWNYTRLPDAMGCEEWLCKRVTSCAELDEAISMAESCSGAAYIEIVTDRYSAPELANKLHDSLNTLYSTS